MPLTSNILAVLILPVELDCIQIVALMSSLVSCLLLSSRFFKSRRVSGEVLLMV